MLKRNLKLAAFGWLLGATLVLPLTVRAQEPPAAPSSGAPAAGAPPMGMPPGFAAMTKDPHPAVHRSQRMLERTKFVLERDTEPDPGDHRANALKSVNAAIEALKAASDAMDKK